MGMAVELDKVRIGFIGVGARGSGHVNQLCHIEGAEIQAICDIDADAAERSANSVLAQGLPKPDTYTNSELAYRDMLDRQDIDIDIISTPWRWHTPMAVDTMLSGKHAFVEVPAATTLEECWQLVDTAERTQKNCMMMENVNYGRDELMVLNMVRRGLFGELLHGEAAYIHDLRSQMHHIDKGTGSWRTHWHTKVNGNMYPTHGLGPIAQYMNINRGDRFDYVSSFGSPALGRALYAKREFPAEHERNQLDYICADINTSVIKTVKGRTIMVQHDTTTPRPYTRHNLIQGTNGVYAGFPDRIAVNLPQNIQSQYDAEYQKALTQWETAGKAGDKPQPHNTHHWDSHMEKWRREYEHSFWLKVGEKAQRVGGHGGMDFVMLWRMIYCLRNNQPLDQDVYDAAAWSAIFPLSIASSKDRSNSKSVPDFTRGEWKSARIQNY